MTQVWKVVVGVAGLAVGGCRTSTLPPAAQGDVVASANYPRVVVLDGLQPFVAIAEPRVTKSPEDPLRVTVPVRAVTEHEELNVQYRFEFLDELGRPIEPSMSWRYERLPSKAQRFFEGNALDQRATDWRLEIRPAR